MSALGQKRICAVRKGMSALPLKADIAPSFLNRRQGIGMKVAHTSFSILRNSLAASV
jgi:hypothetical protein